MLHLKCVSTSLYKYGSRVNRGFNAADAHAANSVSLTPSVLQKNEVITGSDTVDHSCSFLSYIAVLVWRVAHVSGPWLPSYILD